MGLHYTCTCSLFTAEVFRMGVLLACEGVANDSVLQKKR